MPSRRRWQYPVPSREGMIGVPSTVPCGGTSYPQGPGAPRKDLRLKPGSASHRHSTAGHAFRAPFGGCAVVVPAVALTR
jgi:hypothetical protein